MDNFNHPTAGISGLLTKGDQGVFPPNPSSLEPVELLGISFPIDIPPRVPFKRLEAMHKLHHRWG